MPWVGVKGHGRPSALLGAGQEPAVSSHVPTRETRPSWEAPGSAWQTGTPPQGPRSLPTGTASRRHSAEAVFSEHAPRPAAWERERRG